MKKVGKSRAMPMKQMLPAKRAEAEDCADL